MHHKLTSTRTSPLAPAGASSHRKPASGTLLTLLAATSPLLAACSADPNSEPASPSTTQAAALASEQTPSAMKASIAPSQTPSSLSPTATPSPRPSTTIQPPIPSGIAFENSADGAEAYAHFLFQAWWYLINTLDIEWWDANIPDCGWKTAMRDSALHLIKNETLNETAPINPQAISRKVNPENGSEFGITLHANVSDIYKVTKDGARSVAYPGEEYELIARLLHNGISWDAVAVVTQGMDDSN